MSFAEQQELANLSPHLALPKSKGKTLTRVFEQLCLSEDASVEARQARIRQAGFVPTRGWRRGARDFVSNDLRPLVRIRQDGKSCAVAARARSGQQVEIERSIARWFPMATQLQSADQKQIWQTGRHPDEGIGILRDARGPDSNEIMLAIVQL